MNSPAPNAAPLRPAAVGPGERFSVTVLFSLIVHSVLALGITFSYEDPAASLPTLDVTLVETRSADRPDNPDFLANANQRGGGDDDQARRPRQTVSGEALDAIPAEQQPSVAMAPPPQPRTPEPVITTRAKTERTAPAAAQTETTQPAPRLISGHELMQRSAEMARLAADIDRRAELYAKRPRRKFISANTAEYAYAAYMRAWVARVERIGNLNYPADARARRLSGALVLTVAVRRDGSVEGIDVIQSSGHQVLDDAALAVVQLAAPFAPLPRTDDPTDVLHITRTWQFRPGGLTTQ